MLPKQRVGKFQGAMSILQSAGFELRGGVIALGQRGTPDRLTEVYKLLRVEGQRLRIPDNDLPPAPPQKMAAAPARASGAKARKVAFDPFASNITRFTPQPRSGKKMSETEAQLEKMREESQALQSKTAFQDEERGIVLLANSASSGRRGRSLEGEAASSEDGRGDMSFIMKAAKRRREEMKRSETFQTRAMREIEKLKNMRLYQEALLKIVFPDRKTVVQARFSPQETEADIRGAHEKIEHSVEGLPFQLCGPPKAFLRRRAPERAGPCRWYTCHGKKRARART